MVSWRTFAGALLALLVLELVLHHLDHNHPTFDPRLGWVWRSTTVVRRLREGWAVSHWRADTVRVVPSGAPHPAFGHPLPASG